jgi:ribosomal protein L12E/L44/L45/RPP1/RPP2
MRISKIILTILAATILSYSITYGAIYSFATPAPDMGSTDGNTVIGDNDTFRQFMTCMLDTDGDENISEEEITSVLEAGSDDPVIVEEGEIKDCFEPLYVTGTVTASPPSSANIESTDVAETEDSATEENEESSETDDGDEGGE